MCHASRCTQRWEKRIGLWGIVVVAAVYKDLVLKDSFFKVSIKIVGNVSLDSSFILCFDVPHEAITTYQSHYVSLTRCS